MMGNNLTKEFVNRYKNIHETDNIVDVITGSNITLCEVHLDKEIDKNMYENFKGFYHKENSKKSILYNSNMDENERKVVLCHELGHATHHPNINVEFLRENSLFNESKYEKKANYFAAEYIINDEFIHEYKYFTEENAAKILGVPVDLIRLKLDKFDKSTLSGYDEVIP